MLPLTKFSEILKDTRDQMSNDFNELIAASDLIGQRPNYLTVDEHGFYHLQASGRIEEVLAAVEQQLERLKRIKKQRDQT